MRPGVKKKFLTEAVLPGLVLNMPFNGDTKDYSGFGNDGTNYGATWTDGKSGRALSFDGINDYVGIVNEPSLNPVYISISLWLNVPVSVTGYGRILAKGIAAQYFLSIGDAGAGKIKWYVNRASDSSGDGIDSALTYNDGKTHYVTATWDGITLRLYIDSIQTDTKAFSGTLKVTTNNIGIGSNHTGAENLNCIMDNVRIYNRALNPIEIWEEYQRGL